MSKLMELVERRAKMRKLDFAWHVIGDYLDDDNIENNIAELLRDDNRHDLRQYILDIMGDFVDNWDEQWDLLREYSSPAEADLEEAAYDCADEITDIYFEAYAQLNQESEDDEDDAPHGLTKMIRW